MKQHTSKEKFLSGNVVEFLDISSGINAQIKAEKRKREKKSELMDIPYFMENNFSQVIMFDTKAKLD